MLIAEKELDYHYPFPEEIEYENIHPKPKKVPKKPKRKKNKKDPMVKLLIIGLAIIGLILSLVILYGYVNITNIRTEITALEREKMELAREEQDLVSELETVKSSLKIENDAIIKLGMDYPKEGQLVYVDVENIDLNKDTYDKIDKSDDFSLVRQFKNIVNLVSSFF